MGWLDNIKQKSFGRIIILVSIATAVFVVALGTFVGTRVRKRNNRDGGAIADNDESSLVTSNSSSSAAVGGGMDGTLTISPNPSSFPTFGPLTSTPSTSLPTMNPSSLPSISPTITASFAPSTVKPSTETSTNEPTIVASASPTVSPSSYPTITSSANPSSDPTPAPSTAPTILTPSPSEAPSSSPTFITPATYFPGNLTTLRVGLLLSEGLDAREIASTGDRVEYFDGTKSDDVFHGRPDGAATFPDTRPENLGGWIYVSNSEMLTDGEGGVGAITFNKDGEVIDFKMLLEGTTANCSGGRTPWNTWISCEEVEFHGNIYQVDPLGIRPPEMITLGSDGGRWESFAFDIRDMSQPRFYATEDHNKGTVRRFTPSVLNWDDPWTMLTGPGVTDYLMIHPNATNDGGTYEWTTNLNAAKNNARAYYPQTEGIDVYKNEMVFVCKRIYQAFTLDLDGDTYFNHTTVSGLFDGKPDQMQRILNSPRDLLYFTEEGGKDAGIHARDYNDRYYTILESPVYTDETTGLAFSPDAKHMYVAYQDNGKLFDVWRKDGHPFHYERLDVKYHQAKNG